MSLKQTAGVSRARYFVDAWIDQGAQCLEIQDADSGAVKLRWVYNKVPDQYLTSNKYCGGEHVCSACKGLQRLFKELFLLSCSSKINLIERAVTQRMGEECLLCNACNTEDDELIRYHDSLLSR